MRVLLDTNILIGALITKGTPPDELYQAWLRGEFDLVTSEAQMAEIANVLARPRLQRFLSTEESEAIVEEIRTRALGFDELPSVDLSLDPKDNPILATAIAGKADLIVSGDKRHVLAPGAVGGIPIVTAREALKRLGISSWLANAKGSRRPELRPARRSEESGKGVLRLFHSAP